MTDRDQIREQALGVLVKGLLILSPRTHRARVAVAAALN